MEEVAQHFAGSLVLSEKESRVLKIGEFAARSALNSTYRFAVVCKVLTVRSPEWRCRRFIKSLSCIWGGDMGVTIREVEGDRFLACFQCEDDMKKVLDREPWIFDRSLIVMAPMGNALSVMEVQLRSAVFWVQVFGVPWNFRTPEVAEAIGGLLGEYKDVMVDENGSCFGACVCVRVRMDVSEPLLRCAYVEFPEFEDQLIKFRYENLPEFCQECGLIGHPTMVCFEMLKITSKPESERPFPLTLIADADVYGRRIGRPVSCRCGEATYSEDYGSAGDSERRSGWNGRKDKRSIAGDSSSLSKHMQIDTLISMEEAGVGFNMTIDDGLSCSVWHRNGLRCKGGNYHPFTSLKFCECEDPSYSELIGSSKPPMTLDAQRASTSASSSLPKYDVFISFNGETRNGFTGHLYEALKGQGINVFMDQDLKKGTPISKLFTIIEESWFAIIILSEKYVSSRWCLDELSKVFDCMEIRNTIIPVFFNVEPGTFVEAINKRTQRFLGLKSLWDTLTLSQKNARKLQQWKIALRKVAGIAGWISKDRSEAALIKEIVKLVRDNVLCTGCYRRIKLIVDNGSHFSCCMCAARHQECSRGKARSHHDHPNSNMSNIRRFQEVYSAVDESTDNVSNDQQVPLSEDADYEGFETDLDTGAVVRVKGGGKNGVKPSLARPRQPVRRWLWALIWGSPNFKLAICLSIYVYVKTKID